MKFCTEHWGRLREAIDLAGMGHLGAKTGEKAVERLADEIKGTVTNDTFDPLMSAHNEILRRFLEPLGADGLYIFSGDYCPLCELVKINYRPPDHPGIDANWISGVVSDLRGYCEHHGLLAPSN